LIVFQVLCGFFAAHVAGQKGRSRLRWWCIGAFVPAFGVVLSLVIPARGEASGFPAPADGAEAGEGEHRDRRKRPRRCCGRYLPDCHGCPHFRRRLFDPARPQGRKGHCDFYDVDLVAQRGDASSRISIEDRSER
ncbi:MAG: hypothetical protein PVJ27_10830, partial [Candidatus Brocadiaceae bacterium]|jgi:hypothetical protein